MYGNWHKPASIHFKKSKNMNTFKFFGQAIRSVLNVLFRGNLKSSDGLNILSGINLGSDPIGNFIASQTGSRLTGAQEAQNAWSAAEAEAAFNREKELYSERYQLAVSDMEKAGLNPALMYNGNMLGSGVTSPQAQSMPISTGQGLQGLFSLVSALNNAKVEKDLGKQRNDIFQEQIEVEKYRAQTERMAAESQIKVNELRNEYQNTLNYIIDSTKDVQINQIKNNNDLTKEQIYYTQALKDNVLAQIDLYDVQILSEQQKAGLYAAEAAFKSMESWQIAQLTPALRELYNAEKEGIAANTAAQKFANRFNQFLEEKGAWTDTYNQMHDAARISHASAAIAEGTVVNDFAFFMATLGKHMLSAAGVGLGVYSAGLFSRGASPVVVRGFAN